MLQYLVFTYRRTVRRWRREARLLRRAVEGYLNQHVWGKWRQVSLVRRFLVSWFGLSLVMMVGLRWQTGALARLDLVARPVAGGSWREAAVGSVKILNPVLPENAASADLDRLIFSGLTQYNNHRQVVPDLATSWEVSTDGKTYTFHLRHGVTWHDNVPFTSADVVFTLAAIQNPDSRSPLAASWQGVTATAPDDYTVVFHLADPFTPFIDSTTVGIIPRHLLESIDPSQLREASFNQAPIGTGPFKLTNFAPKANEVVLTANPAYFGGRPRLDNFVFKFYDSDAAALQAFVKHDVNAVSRVNTNLLASAGHLQDLTLPELSLPTETVLFFRLGDATLSDLQVRQALAESLDRQHLISQAGATNATPLTQPILPGQLGYTEINFATPYNPAQAAQTLAAAGWVRGADGVMQKDGHPLALTLVTLANSNYAKLAQAIAEQWQAVGVQAHIKAVDLQDLEQTYIRPRNYQLLLYGLNLGADPDVYAYWHSSQVADPGLNLSQYNSSVADQALESGRIKQDPQIRQGKYQAFLKAWNADLPAVVLSSSPYVYGLSRKAFGLQVGQIVEPADRFYEVEHWTIRTRLVLPGAP